MKHFGDEDWADLVRGVASEEKRRKMDEHLESGCDRCRTGLAFWQETSQGASRESAYEPPRDTVRIVKGMMRARPSKSLVSPLAVLADLIMDSSQMPALAGVRSSGMVPRLLLFRSGNVNIDLRIEQVPLSSRVSVVGQVLDLAQSNQAIIGAAVAAISEGVETETTTSKHGEFHLEFEPGSQMYLSVRMAEKKEICVPLCTVGPEQVGGTVY